MDLCLSSHKEHFSLPFLPRTYIKQVLIFQCFNIKLLRCMVSLRESNTLCFVFAIIVLWQLKYIKTYYHQSHIRHCQADRGIHYCLFLVLILITVISSALEWPNASLLCGELCAHYQPLYSWGVCWGLIEKGKLTHSKTLSVCPCQSQNNLGLQVGSVRKSTYATHLMA